MNHIIKIISRCHICNLLNTVSCLHTYWILELQYFRFLLSKKPSYSLNYISIKHLLFLMKSYFAFVGRLSKLPGCLLVCLLAIPIDVLMITGLALWKSPYMLLKGWQRLFQDLVGREGPFLETVCVPFAGLAILLWPLAVIGAVLAAFSCSFFLGLYAGVIAYQVSGTYEL